jgi:hypothetical protein
MSRRGFGRESGSSIATNFSNNFLASQGAIFSLKPQAKYLTGARTVLKINGNAVAFAFSVTWSVKTEVTEINTIDDPMPWELAPRRIEVTGTLGLFQLPGQSPQALRYQSDIAAFLANKYISIEVRDSASDAVIFRAGSAMVTGQQSEVNSEQVARTLLTWRAIGWQAENAPVKFTNEELQSDPNTFQPAGALGWVKSKLNIK